MNMKIKEINGELYSNEEFDGYVTRVLVRLFPFDSNDVLVNIYTTEVDKFKTTMGVLNLINENKVSHFNIEHRATKEQDEAAAAFIEESFKY